MSHRIKRSLISIVVSSSVLMMGCSIHHLDVSSLDKHGLTNTVQHEGRISPEQLLASFPVFKDNKDSDPYKFDSVQVQQLATELQGKQLLVLFGTWCHDSQREVPRLLNLLQSVNEITDEASYGLKLVAINRDKNNSPYIDKFNVKRVPTILVLDEQGKEVRRVTERPLKNLAIDLLK